MLVEPMDSMRTIAAAVMFHTAAFGEAELRGGSVAETYRNAKPYDRE